MHVHLKLGVASALDKLGILNALRWLQSRSGLILTFHRVLDDEQIGSCYESHIAMRVAAFEQILRMLRRDYQVVGLADLLRQMPIARRGRQPVALTFDDGWADTCSIVAPLLQHYQVPATVFLCSSLLEQSQMLPEERFARLWQVAAQQARLPQLLNDLQVWRVADGLGVHMHGWAAHLKRQPLALKLMMLEHLERVYQPPAPVERRFLTWDEARQMQGQGITFGSHTARHACLDAEEPASMLEELVSSRAEIRRELGGSCEMLAYPNGAYNARVIQAASEAGYQYALTTDAGFVSVKTNPLAIPRLSMADPVVEGNQRPLHPARTRLYMQQLGRGSRRRWVSDRGLLADHGAGRSHGSGRAQASDRDLPLAGGAPVLRPGAGAPAATPILDRHR